MIVSCARENFPRTRVPSERRKTKVPSSKSAARISPAKSTSADEPLCRFLAISCFKACQKMSRLTRIVGQASSLPVVRASLPAVFEMATRTNSNSRLEAAPTGRQDACPYNSPLKPRRNSAAGNLLIASSCSASAQRNRSADDICDESCAAIRR